MLLQNDLVFINIILSLKVKIHNPGPFGNVINKAKREEDNKSSNFTLCYCQHKLISIQRKKFAFFNFLLASGNHLGPLGRISVVPVSHILWTRYLGYY